MNIGGVLSGSALSSVLGLAGGPWGMIISQLAQQFLSTVAHNVIDNLNLPTGLSEALKDVVDGRFGEPLGGGQGGIHDLVDTLADAGGASFFERAQMHENADQVANDLSNFILQQMEENRESETGERGGVSRGDGEGGWIRAMAEAMGEKLDDAWHEAEGLADKINKEDPSTTAEYQGAVQEFNFIMQAFSTAIKAAGEGASAMARKQ